MVPQRTLYAIFNFEFSKLLEAGFEIGVAASGGCGDRFEGEESLNLPKLRDQEPAKLAR